MLWAMCSPNTGLLLQLYGVDMGLYHRLRQHIVHAPQAQVVDCSGKTYIVTGAAMGSIGFETARLLASRGAQVIITTRSHPERIVQALCAAVGVNALIDGYELELASAASVNAFVRWYNEHYGEQLNGLINNAGIHLDLLSQWKAPKLTSDGFEIQWRTNYLGTLQLTHGLLPLLQKTGRATGDARIVNVVSQLHSKGFNAGLFEMYDYNSWVAYGMSKLALVHVTFELQRRFSADHLQAYCLHPGAVFTNIADKGLAGNCLLQTLRNAMAPMERFALLTPEEGAQTTLHCATNSQATGGQYYQQCRSREPSVDCRDSFVSARLWNETTAWVASINQVV
jgi:NAD(P)-dependent dehydrogenase (short-subunit alcohol dehydrogenase family)